MMKERSKSSGIGRLTRGVAITIACLTLLLASCKPQPQPDLQPGSVDRVGVLLLSQSAQLAAPSGQATFVELTAVRAEELMNNPFGTQVGSCEVSTAAAPAIGAVAPGVSGNRLLAGNVALKHDGGVYGSLERNLDGRYVLQGATQPLPTTGLSLDLQGNGAFPAFSNVSIDSGQTPELAAGFDASSVTVNTEFEWAPGTAGSAIILVGSSGAVTFSCLVDDLPGRFSFPSATRKELTDAGFGTGSLDTLGRITTHQERAESALLLVGAVRLVNVGTDK